MESYDGRAVVLADGEEYECHASLHRWTDSYQVRAMGSASSVRGLSDWGGEIDVEDAAAAWNIHEANERLLRIDDREGAFIVVAANLGSRELRIRGSGAAPFGDG